MKQYTADDFIEVQGELEPGDWVLNSSSEYCQLTQMSLSWAQLMKWPKLSLKPVEEEDNREFPCENCDEGEYEQVGFTQPNGQVNYECNSCSHHVSFP